MTNINYPHTNQINIAYLKLITLEGGHKLNKSQRDLVDTLYLALELEELELLYVMWSTITY